MPTGIPPDALLGELTVTKRRITPVLWLLVGAGTASAQGRPTRSSMEVDAHSLTVWTAGEARPGVPTIVFSSGFGVDAVTWGDVQSDLAALTATIAYDRSGVVASQPSSRTRTVQNLADEMHAVLAARR